MMHKDTITPTITLSADDFIRRKRKPAPRPARRHILSDLEPHEARVILAVRAEYAALPVDERGRRPAGALKGIAARHGLAYGRAVQFIFRHPKEIEERERQREMGGEGAGRTMMR